jgi:hypothetical protein
MDNVKYIRNRYFVLFFSIALFIDYFLILKKFEQKKIIEMYRNKKHISPYIKLLLAFYTLGSIMFIIYVTIWLKSKFAMV